jgi:hypothetical protein
LNWRERRGEGERRAAGDGTVAQPSVFDDRLRTRNDPRDIGIHPRRGITASVFFFLAVDPDYSFISLFLLPGALFISLVCALPAHPLPSFEVGAFERG